PIVFAPTAIFLSSSSIAASAASTTIVALNPFTTLLPSSPPYHCCQPSSSSPPLLATSPLLPALTVATSVILAATSIDLAACRYCLLCLLPSCNNRCPALTLLPDLVTSVAAQPRRHRPLLQPPLLPAMSHPISRLQPTPSAITVPPRPLPHPHQAALLLPCYCCLLLPCPYRRPALSNRSKRRHPLLRCLPPLPSSSSIATAVAPSFASINRHQ
ncbi:hypothetical protein GW17_00060408, partial [Ensete ventricosum]